MNIQENLKESRNGLLQLKVRKQDGDCKLANFG